MDALLFIFFDVVNKQVKVFIKGWLWLGFELKNLICFVKKLFSKFYQKKILQHVGHHFFVGKGKFRVNPVLILRFFFNRQSFPKLNSLFVAGFNNVEGKFYISKPKLGVFFYIVEQADVAFCKVF